MKTYLINAYNNKNAKKPFIIDIIEARNEQEAAELTINKKYFFNSDKTIILGIAKKVEVIHEIV
jgi:hypothetical protein